MEINKLDIGLKKMSHQLKIKIEKFDLEKLKLIFLMMIAITIKLRVTKKNLDVL
jgi:hypothetical protein